jgi:L-rhamnose mutarotase
MGIKALQTEFTAAEKRTYALELRENPLFQFWQIQDKQGGVNSFVSSEDPATWPKARAMIHHALDWENRIETALKTQDDEVEAAE